MSRDRYNLKPEVDTPPGNEKPDFQAISGLAGGNAADIRQTVGETASLLSQTAPLREPAIGVR